MINCKKCGNEFYPSNGLRNYCSLTCRNSRTHSIDTKIKMSEKNALFWSNLTEEEKKHRLDTFHRPGNTKKAHAALKQKFKDMPFEQLGIDGRRKRIIEQQNGCCNRCGISHWLSHPLIIEIDHKDGDNTNNSRDNLEGLCPNCHSLTSTWRGRNKSIKKVSDDDLLQSYLEEGNIRKALLRCGLTAKGGNYQRVKNLIEKHK